MAHLLEYVRTDKNGTKIFHDWNCPRCGGAGRSSKWCFTGYDCYQCGGTGKRSTPSIVKEYTPEYEAKLQTRRAEREAKRRADNPSPSEEELLARAEEARRNVWEQQGFRRDGVGYIHSGNTYPNKNKLWSAGGRWNGMIRGYIVPCQVEGLIGVNIVEVHAQDICNDYGYVDWQSVEERGLNGYL